ncbi:MAG: hypothetical protein NVV70_13320 [Cellulomonas sp.]|uniref:Uncharacterized protein n=1 Tax=Cellulomonas gelida TaxID=1712 RepID=A0A4Y3KRY2_9CELL|nr:MULTISPECIES: hypothetical protein [Cellulomonas]MCR6649061.1 hypothetical protein [Cellulomonas sp.]MCR6705053.1 hypothetical protein [Cellulomonas sp.]GEA85690.1 hypothetical protein CGE01nite_29410 [Cellulomonas gelida]GGL21359.1 hypothetical protein GCM10009774_09600 [Cellulomonas gelida]
MDQTGLPAEPSQSPATSSTFRLRVQAWTEMAAASGTVTALPTQRERAAA